MAELSTKARKSLPSSDFAGPGRSYPVNDKSHAANAKARATQMVKKGKLSSGAKAKIDAKANKVLGEKKGTPMVPPTDAPKGPIGGSTLKSMSASMPK